MEILTLWPFSQGEIDGRRESFVDILFEDYVPRTATSPKTGAEASSMWERVLRGGYPEVVARSTSKRRGAWFDAYVATILQRDIRDLAHIEGLTQMPNLLKLLSSRATAHLNYSEISRSSGLPQSTLKRYMTLLEATFLIQTFCHGTPI